MGLSGTFSPLGGSLQVIMLYIGGEETAIYIHISWRRRVRQCLALTNHYWWSFIFTLQQRRLADYWCSEGEDCARSHLRLIFHGLLNQSRQQCECRLLGSTETFVDSWLKFGAVPLHSYSPLQSGEIKLCHISIKLLQGEVTWVSQHQTGLIFS